MEGFFFSLISGIVFLTPLILAIGVLGIIIAISVALVSQSGEGDLAIGLGCFILIMVLALLSGGFIDLVKALLPITTILSILLIIVCLLAIYVGSLAIGSFLTKAVIVMPFRRRSSLSNPLEHFVSATSICGLLFFAFTNWDASVPYVNHLSAHTMPEEINLELFRPLSSQFAIYSAKVFTDSFRNIIPFSWAAYGICNIIELFTDD